MAVARKSEFAKLCNVTRGRVTQWITQRLIDGAAIVGSDRRALIDVDLACAQLQKRLVADERYGLNGLSTNISTTTISPGPRERTRKHSDIAFPPRPTRSKPWSTSSPSARWRMQQKPRGRSRLSRRKIAAGWSARARGSGRLKVAG